MKLLSLFLLLFGLCNALSAMDVVGSEPFITFYLRTETQQNQYNQEKKVQITAEKEKTPKEKIVRTDWKEIRKRILEEQAKSAKEQAENRQKQNTASHKTPEDYFGSDWETC